MRQVSIALVLGGLILLMSAGILANLGGPAEMRGAWVTHALR
jgi:hypothetical protein